MSGLRLIAARYWCLQTAIALALGFILAGEETFGVFDTFNDYLPLIQHNDTARGRTYQKVVLEKALRQRPGKATELPALALQQQQQQQQPLATAKRRPATMASACLAWWRLNAPAIGPPPSAA